MSEIIFSYTRKQAIEDGTLVPVNQSLMYQAGFKYPTVITQGLHGTMEEADKGGWASYQGMLWDVLNGMKFATILMKNKKTDRVHFTIRIGTRAHALYSVCHPDDEGKPCLTIMLEGED